MPDLDLRRRALESGKQQSNKSKNRSAQSSAPSSKINSTVNSRSASRAQSRDVSDDEDGWAGGNLSDDTAQSVNSIDALLESDEVSETSTDSLKMQLRDVIESITDSKKVHSAKREESLVRFCTILIAHYLADVLRERIGDLIEAFCKIIKGEPSEKEAILALRGLSLTTVSFQSDTIYEATSSMLKRSISDSQSLPIKAAAIQALGICSCYGGAGEDEIVDNLTFLLEIISSDGSFIGADDSIEVVTAALQAYGFLATYVDDLESESEDAVEALLEQLNAADVRVQIAAGEAIALLFEKSYTPREEDETQSDTGDGTEEEEEDSPSSFGRSNGDTSLVKRYNAYHNAYEVISRTHELAGLSTKSMSKADKRRLHQSFTAIHMTVENPRLGLQTNNASKMVVRVHKEAEMRVDKWWKLLRLNQLRRLLAGGFVNHYFEGNQQILDSLPMIMRNSENGSGTASPRKNKARAGDKFRDSRRFVSAGADAE